MGYRQGGVPSLRYEKRGGMSLVSFFAIITFFSVKEFLIIDVTDTVFVVPFTSRQH